MTIKSFYRDADGNKTNKIQTIFQTADLEQLLKYLYVYIMEKSVSVAVLVRSTSILGVHTRLE